ncbi:ESX secretion-associated protein EspG [Lentzea flaviverrucosa]|uniref:EspG family protein n=1 Tax=Lentzea flaviverrucosa TaxID=200379 RepID=A0A1H9TXZ7_9PSEU|nr:ESX secretion-associated protein EspG [Lentzea flaviverrucosa]RDI33431.1 ESAT-6 protein secretion system EspG family protein [Lentzea flaviverrucosa]SES01633.1 EspG family protein [Lentzea flaviverrucosa]
MTLFGLDAGTSDTRDPVVISTLEFDVLWDHLGLETMPLVLKVPSPGKTTEERRAIEDQVWLQLGARGLGGPRSLDPTLEDLLHVLNRPQQEIDARMWLHERSLRVLAAGKGQAGVLAVLDGTQLVLRPAEADGLPREALTALPTAPAGEGHSITLPSADLDAAATKANTPEELEEALRGTLRADDAHTLAEMIRDASNRGQFGAAARDKWGKRVRPDRVVAFYDTPKGRYLQMRRAAEGQPPWSTITPVDYRRMHHHLVELLAEAAGA